MIVVSFSPSAVAATVWAQASRSLTADPATDAGCATLVWNHATKPVTSIAAAYTEVTGRPSVGAGAKVDLRPSAGKFRFLSAGGNLGGGANALGLYDGTNFDGPAGAWGTPGAQQQNGGSTRGPALSNPTGGALTSAYGGWDIG